MACASNKYIKYVSHIFDPFRPHLGHSDPTWAIPTPLGPFKPCHTHINSNEHN